MKQIQSSSSDTSRFHKVMPVAVFIFGLAFIVIAMVALSGRLYSAPRASGPTSCPPGMKIKEFADRRCKTVKGRRVCETTQNTTCVVNQFYNPNKTLQNR